VLMIVWKPRGFIGTREPTVALGKRKAIDATLVREGHG
jgi:branched-chain amino acid transport system permease protein